LPRWVIIVIDLVIIAVSTLLGYLLRFNFEWTDVIRYDLPLGIAIQVAVSLLAIYVTGSYRGIVRYSGIQDSVRIIYMLGLSFVLSIFINLAAYYITQNNIIPYSVVLISILSSFLFLINYRLLVKQMFTHYRERISKKIRVLVYGAGQTGIITRHVIDSTPRMKTFGFIEDDENKVNKLVDGIKIYDASPESLQYLIQHYSINEIVITVKELSYERKNELVDVCIQNRVRVRAVPPVGKWVRGELSINQIREMKIEELLGRESIRIVNPSIEQDLFGKRVLITGAAGSIGSELVRQVLTYQPEQMILVDQAESPLYELEREVRAHSRLRFIPYVADITNEDRMARIFEEHKPTHVYHAAAYKHVPLMEGNPSEAVMTNILGTKCVADLAVRFGVKKFVMISTDKAVNPTNVMGCSKRIAEIYVQSLNNHLRNGTHRHTEFVTTRFGNVLGSNGSVIPIFKKQIEEGGPVTVTHPEITRFFMTIPEACQLVLEAGTMSSGGEIFIFDMGQSVKILDLARKMIRLSGREPDRDIEIVFTGLREGEKLYEELLNNSENTLPTHHNKILIAQVREYEYQEVNKYVDLFHDLVNDANELKMVALMKEIVPEYKSNYSRYEVLDNR
jgi:FlaA1/EpsC-like NDP-sugar epimerase